MQRKKGKQKKEQGGSFGVVKNVTRSKFQMTVTEFKNNGLSWMPQGNRVGLRYLFSNGISWWRWSHRAWRGAWSGLRESTDGQSQTKQRPSPMQPLLWKAAIASHKGWSDMSGRRAGGQQAAGGAQINEEVQNEREQQLEPLVVTSGTEPEKTTLLSHLLCHYN